MRLPIIVILVTMVACVRAAVLTVPEVTQSIPAQGIGAGSGTASIDLGNFFDVAGVSGQVVQLSTGYGKINVEMLSDSAPNTVTNFLSYVNSGVYTNTLFHRSVPGFVLQAGGYFLNNAGQVDSVVAGDPVANEFNVSNTRGTLAMAKVGNDPDSATSQWFFNLVDNSANLDNQNGGFTVFARVLGTGMTVADAIAALQPYDVSSYLGDDFTQTPLQNVQNNQQDLYISNLVVVSSAKVVPICPAVAGGPSVISFSVESTNPATATASVSGRMLNITKITGSAAFTVRAEDSNGNSAATTFIASSTGLTVGVGQTAIFRVPNMAASTFQWQRLPAGSKVWVTINDGDGYTGTTTAILTVPANLAISGDQYHCVVTTGGKGKASATQLMTVTAVAPNVAHQSEAVVIAGGGAIPGTIYYAKGLPAGLKINAATGQITGVVTAKAGVYTFTTWSQVGKTKSVVMTRAFVVQAFLPTMTGAYEGLLFSTGGAPTGKVEILVTATGAFSGKFTYWSGFTATVKGMFTLNADTTSATVNLNLGGGVVLALAIDRNQAFRGTLTIPVTGKPASVDTIANGTKVGGYSTTSPAPWKGSYAMTLGDVGTFNDLRLFPSGAGHAVVTIAPTGIMSFRGKLADGTILAGSYASDAMAIYRPFVMPYKRQWSVLAGFLPLSPRAGQPSTYDVASGQGQAFYWVKDPGAKDKLFPAGFGFLGLNLSVEPWTPVADVATLASKLGLGSGRTLTLLLSCTQVTGFDADTGAPTVVTLFSNQAPDNTFSLPITVTLPTSGKSATLTGTGTSKVTITVNLKDGSFTGSISLAANGSTPARVVPIEGSLLQLVAPAPGDTVGQGFFLLPGATKTDPTLSGLIKLSVLAAPSS